MTTRLIACAAPLLIAAASLPAFPQNFAHSAAAASPRINSLETRTPANGPAWGLVDIRFDGCRTGQECESMPHGDIIEIGSVSDLEDALAAATGGETLVLAGGDYGGLSIRGRQYEATVTITSADPDDPAVFGGSTLKNSANVTVDGVTFDYTYAEGDPEWKQVVVVEKSTGITFRNTEIIGDDQINGETSIIDGYPTGVGLYVRNSADVTLVDSKIGGTWKGAIFWGNTGLTIEGNEITGVREDGMFFRDVHDVRIENNHFHDFDRFFGRYEDGDFDHSDMIQFFGRAENDTQVSSGITLRGNTFDVGDTEGWTQTIFMPNKNGGDRPYAYRDVTIEENVIINDHIHGIKVGATDGLTVRNNTLLHREATDPEKSGYGAPQIHIGAGSNNVVMEGNVSHHNRRFKEQPDWQVVNNFTVQKGNPDKAGYYGDIMLDAGDLGVPDNLTVLPGSEIHAAGAGATRLLYDPTPESVRALARGDGDGLTHSFDAGLSAAPAGSAEQAGATFTWDFGDGTTGTGAEVTHTYATGGHYTVTLRVEMPDGTSDDFSTDRAVVGADLLRYDAAVGDFLAEAYGAADPLGMDLPLTTLADGSEALALGETATIVAPEAVDRLSGALNFRMALELRATDGAAGSGEILKIPGALMLSMTEAGELTVTMVDGGTNRTVETEGAGLADGAWHDMTLAFDGTGQGLDVRVDGTSVGRIEMTGTLPAIDGAALRLGGAESDGFTGEIRGLDLDTLRDAVIAGPGSGANANAPIDEAAITDEDTFVVTDSVLPEAEGGTYAVGAVDTSVTLGRVTDNGDGTFGYDPNGAFDLLGHGASAVDTFDFTLTDATGGTRSGTMTITVTGLNDAPVAVADGPLAVDRNGSVEIDVLANDSDAEDGAPSLAAFTQAGRGTVTENATGLLYTPQADYSGTDGFTYTLVDSTGATDTATVTLDVAPGLLDETFDHAGALTADALHGGAVWTSVDGDGRITLADGGWAELSGGRDLAGLQRFGISVDFAVSGEGGRGVVFSHGHDLMVEVVETRLKFTVPTADGVARSFTDVLPQLHQGGLHDLDIAVDVEVGSLIARLDGETVYTCDAPGLDLAALSGGDWLLGSPWKTSDAGLEISSIAVTTPDAVPVPDGAAAPPVDTATARLQAGSVTVIQDTPDQWHRVTFAEAIPDARVVMGPVSANGGHPAIARVRDVTNTGFEFQIDEWDYLDGGHMSETVSWMAGSAGTHSLASGATIAFGRVGLSDETPLAVSLPDFADAPAVFAQVTSANGGDAVTTRLDDVGAAGFTLRMQEEEAGDQRHVGETADWMAITYGAGGAGASVTDHGGTPVDVRYGEDTVFLAAMQSENGPDTAALRYDLGSAGRLRLFVEEERSADRETGHVDEEVAYLALETGSYTLDPLYLA